MDYIERGIAWVLKNKRGRDAGLIPNSNPFSNVREPTITLECPDIGPSGSEFPASFSMFAEGRFPTLEWKLPEDFPEGSEVKEWLLVIQDPDAPLPDPVTHGIYYSIPADKTSLAHADFELVAGAADGEDKNSLKGGFKYGVNRRTNVYMPPRGLMGHGSHRFFYQIVALREPIDTAKLSPVATKEEIIAQIDGKVIAWGQWIGMWERKP
ncbi:hypothetical protein UA08_01759 [Talaromyces atroroseus]|uniref:Uncharacterized protein n=1 Tax=Talaromyces atroroseus TaxID=1441469 RepID=A0A1Q5QC78_TALAT|nr:hypothetical protein UA08_01759 [Talaromyces atroroseus]OKL63369.1 hypothetical protein UA08_01759 [Talaromyces atroroseus]